MSAGLLVAGLLVVGLCAAGLHVCGNSRSASVCVCMCQREGMCVCVRWRCLTSLPLGQVGNFVAYGDKNTPASVVTAVGCVGVIANLVISTVWLGEPFRKRDVFGGGFVVGGVLLIVMFAPQQSQVLLSRRYPLIWGFVRLGVAVLFRCWMGLACIGCSASRLRLFSMS